jgi:hypothetical protein
MTYDVLVGMTEKAFQFKEEAHLILSIHESSKYRLVQIDKTRKKISALSLLQTELFEQSISCVEQGIFRAAHVMAWAGFIDFLEHKINSDGLIKIKNARPGWVKYNSIEELRENIPEFQLIEATYNVGLFSKAEMKTILGLLSKRNECAHPTSYKPGMNESLGYISELFNRIEVISKKVY